MSSVAVLGAGAWGQALALLADGEGHAVTLHARRPDALLDGRRGSRRLPDAIIPARLTIASLADAPDADLILVAVPVAHLRATLAVIGNDAGPSVGDDAAPLVLCCKGMEVATEALPAEIAASCCPTRPIALLSGPNFAHEIARGLPSAVVLAAPTLSLAAYCGSIIGTTRFRVYPSDDPVGVGVCGAAKNVIAIAAGVAIGAALGENARAALIARGLAETGRLARALGGRADTVAGLAGLGDLVLTATGAGSRNYRTGLAIGRGNRAATFVTDEVAEGVATAAPLLARGTRAGVDLPITSAVAALLAGRLTVAGAVEKLSSRGFPHPETSDGASG